MENLERSLPGAIGMYALSVGVQNIGESLPLPVYALLSGLNASTVGIIALAAVQLAEKAIRDKMTRILVIFGACAGLCYNALWYFPSMMIFGGLATVIWDGWMAQHMRKLKLAWQRRHSRPAEAEEAPAPASASALELAETRGNGNAQIPTESHSDASIRSRKTPAETLPQSVASSTAPAQPLMVEEDHAHGHVIRIRTGIFITIVFFGKSPNSVNIFLVLPFFFPFRC